MKRLFNSLEELEAYCEENDCKDLASYVVNHASICGFSREQLIEEGFYDVFQCEQFGIADSVEDFERLKIDGKYTADICETMGEKWFYVVLIDTCPLPMFVPIELARSIPELFKLHIG